MMTITRLTVACVLMLGTATAYAEQPTSRGMAATASTGHGYPGQVEIVLGKIQVRQAMGILHEAQKFATQGFARRIRAFSFAVEGKKEKADQLNKCAAKAEAEARERTMGGMNKLLKGVGMQLDGNVHVAVAKLKEKICGCCSDGNARPSAAALFAAAP